MKKLFCLNAVLVALISGCSTVNTEAVHKPTLTAFAKLDVGTYADGPVSGHKAKPVNGFVPPFKAQPVQGFSGALKNKDNTYTVLADNGFGAQDNSDDFLLRIYTIKPDFRTQTSGKGDVEVLKFISLRDPNKLVPFAIVNENTQDRLLTGADFDPESIQRAPDGSYWVGEEFGPFLLHFSANGILLDAPFSLPSPTQANTHLRSPQNKLAAEQNQAATVQRSGGFEGMALSKDGRFLYPMLEKPLSDSKEKKLLISQFSLQDKQYTGKHYFFKLHDKATAIGDFQLYDNQSGVIIERDDTENKLDGYKKIIQITLGESGQEVARKEVVDLMNIANPHLLYTKVRKNDVGVGETFAFPFFTIEDVIIESPYRLTILNDNNFPGSSGRNAKLADDNEIIQIQLPQKLF